MKLVGGDALWDGSCGKDFQDYFRIFYSDSAQFTFSNHSALLNEVRVGRLFERFYTVETAEKSTGLGLSIAKALTEQMDGQISAQYNAGTVTIIVRFCL